MRKNIFLFILIISVISCSKADDPETATKPQNQSKFFLSGLETFYGTKVPIMQDPVSFKVDSLNRTSEISNYITTHTISYPNSNLIVSHSIANYGNAILDGITNIYLENNTVKKICRKKVYKYSNNAQDQESDSTLFTYSNSNNLIHIDFFEKRSGSSAYELKSVYEYMYENGNVTKFSKMQYGDVTTLNYSYDNQPNIDYGEYAPGMPFVFDYYYPLIYNKLGKRNVNNIIKATYTYSDPTSVLGLYHFDSIDYERDVNSKGLLTAIRMSGHITSSDLTTTMMYDDGKVSFAYR